MKRFDGTAQPAIMLLTDGDSNQPYRMQITRSRHLPSGIGDHAAELQRRWPALRVTDGAALLLVGLAAQGLFVGRTVRHAVIVANMRLHDLRYSCATLLLAQGVNPRVVMETLRHSQVSLTLNTYSHVHSRQWTIRGTLRNGRPHCWSS